MMKPQRRPRRPMNHVGLPEELSTSGNEETDFPVDQAVIEAANRMAKEHEYQFFDLTERISELSTLRAKLNDIRYVQIQSICELVVGAIGNGELENLKAHLRANKSVREYRNQTIFHGLVRISLDITERSSVSRYAAVCSHLIVAHGIGDVPAVLKKAGGIRGLCNSLKLQNREEVSFEDGFSKTAESDSVDLSQDEEWASVKQSPKLSTRPAAKSLSSTEVMDEWEMPPVKVDKPKLASQSSNAAVNKARKVHSDSCSVSVSPNAQAAIKAGLARKQADALAWLKVDSNGKGIIREVTFRPDVAKIMGQNR